MLRVVTAEMDLHLGASVDLVFQVAASSHTPLHDETFTLRQGDRPLTATEIIATDGSRLHRLTGEPGPLELRYRAVVTGPATASPTGELDRITYLRPSRYCQSDELFGQARRQFRGLAGRELLRAVEDFVATSTTYAPGLSQGTDSAVTTLMTGQGVCRDYAHVVIALLRAMDVPARYTACYAPGLEPMDFHAVAEAYLDGRWYVLDATRLADRRSLVRIATGRDAADCAFLSYHGGAVTLERLRVDARRVNAATPDGDPSEGRGGVGEIAGTTGDDHTELVQLS